MLSGGATIFSVIDGNGRRERAVPGRSNGFVIVLPVISLRSSKTSMASSGMSIVGSSTMVPPRAELPANAPSLALTAAATASRLKIVVTASYAVSSSSWSSPPMHARMYRGRAMTGTDHFPCAVLLSLRDARRNTSATTSLPTVAVMCRDNKGPFERSGWQFLTG